MLALPLRGGSEIKRPLAPPRAGQQGGAAWAAAAGEPSAVPGLPKPAAAVGADAAAGSNNNTGSEGAQPLVAEAAAPLSGGDRPSHHTHHHSKLKPAVVDPAEVTLRMTLRAARRSRSFVLLVVGFFACGFHV
eukprot:COSAG01_NODE_121_length_25291_cov_10.011670_6_plen_133_part_00